MATALDSITRAFRMARIVASEEQPTDAEAADALITLNDMLHGWAKEGVDLGHITMALTDTHKTHDSWLRGIRANLAVDLAEEYGLPVPPRIARIAESTFAAFQAHSLEFSDDLKVDRALNPRYYNSNRRAGAFNFDEN